MYLLVRLNHACSILVICQGWKNRQVHAYRFYTKLNLVYNEYILTPLSNIIHPPFMLRRQKVYFSISEAYRYTRISKGNLSNLICKIDPDVRILENGG